MDNILTHSPFKATASKHFPSTLNNTLLLNSSILKAQMEQCGVTERRYCWSQHAKQPQLRAPSTEFDGQTPYIYL